MRRPQAVSALANERVYHLPPSRWPGAGSAGPGAAKRRRPDAGVGAVTVAKSYRLLKAILNTAADDGRIRRNPCRIKGAAVEKSPERPVLTARQVFDLAAAIDPRYQALVLLAVFGSLRRSELAALRRCDVDLTAQTIQV